MSFPLFPRLPPEIQDAIWASAISPHQPEAHLVKLETTYLELPGANASARSTVAFHRVDHPERATLDPETTPDAIVALLATTRASRRVAQRISKATRPELALVRGPLPCPEAPAGFHGGPLRRPVRVDVAADLILLSHDQLVYTGVASTTQRLDSARYIAFNPLAMTTTGGLGQHASDPLHMVLSWLTRVYDLWVVYALVPPELLSAARGTPFPRDHALFSYILERFLSAYDGGAAPPGPWVRGGREYYEVPKEEVRRLGGLWQMIGVIEVESRIMDPAKPGRNSTRRRLMTWRDL